MVNVYNASGGRIEIIADGEAIASAEAPPTTGLASSYGFLSGAVWVGAGGVYDVGVRITRPVLAGEEVFQYVDNFSIWTCYPDCTGSGSLTIADYTCFQTKFVAGDPYADCNNNGTLTVSDFTCFLTQYTLGCP